MGRAGGATVGSDRMMRGPMVPGVASGEYYTWGPDVMETNGDG